MNDTTNNDAMKPKAPLTAEQQKVADDKAAADKAQQEAK
jgi:hypothetical protein